MHAQRQEIGVILCVNSSLEFISLRTQPRSMEFLPFNIKHVRHREKKDEPIGPSSVHTPPQGGGANIRILALNTEGGLTSIHLLVEKFGSFHQ